VDTEAGTRPGSFECSVCLGRTYNPNDIAAAYCPCCGSSVEPKQCQHPRLYENRLPAPEGGKSDWYLYRLLCPHGYTAQQVVRPPGGTIPTDVQVEAVMANHHRLHECRCFVPVMVRYRERMAAQPDVSGREN
jgi:hypothetical protein